MTLLFLLILIFYSKPIFSEIYEPKNSINGSGLKIPRMVSLKDKLTYMRSGPGKEYPIKYKFRKRGYPLKIIAEFNNWRKVTTYSNLSGWIHTQLLSSLKTGLILKDTYLKKRPSNLSNSKAKILKGLVVNIKECRPKWCEIKIIREKIFSGWVKKDQIWGSK